MLLPEADIYAVDYVNKYGQTQDAKIIATYDNRAEEQSLVDKHEMGGCAVYAEHGQELYRVICEQSNMKREP